jgi:hypothetical protein
MIGIRQNGTLSGLCKRIVRQISAETWLCVDDLALQDASKFPFAVARGGFTFSATSRANMRRVSSRQQACARQENGEEPLRRRTVRKKEALSVKSQDDDTTRGSKFLLRWVAPLFSATTPPG